MAEEYKRKFITVEKITRGFSLGVCLTLDFDLNEYYLFLNIGKWTVSIGWLKEYMI